MSRPHGTGWLGSHVVFHNTMVDRITSQRDGDSEVPRAEPLPAKALVIEDLQQVLPAGLQDAQSTPKNVRRKWHLLALLRVKRVHLQRPSRRTRRRQPGRRRSRWMHVLQKQSANERKRRAMLAPLSSRRLPLVAE